MAEDLLIRFFTWVGSPELVVKGAERFHWDPEKSIHALAAAHSNAAKRMVTINWLTGGTRAESVRDHKRACFHALREEAELQETQTSKS